MSLPDLIEIVPLDKPVRAEITVPGSKSITNRALILAALADDVVTLEGALWSEDTQVMTEALVRLGFEIKVENDPDEFCNRRITVKGLGGKIPNTGTAEKPLELFVGNAGTAARFLAAMVCLGNGVYRLSGVPRMHERPQAALFKVLRELGYRVESANDKLPATIFGSSRRESAQTSSAEISQSRLTSAATVSIEESSQFASALILSAKHGGWDVKIIGENVDESPYVTLTTKLIEDFATRTKYHSEYRIDVDASSASYFNALPIPFPEEQGFREYVKNWRGTTWQVDSRFVYPFLSKQTEISREHHLGDSIMTGIVLSPLLDYSIRFTDLGRLRVQECERVVALRTELTKCGAKVVEEGDTLTVHPSKLHGAEIETYNDHRMAMCFAILGLKVPGIKLKNPACVKKTFPNFFQKLAAPPPGGLGATILDGRTGRKLGMDELFAD
ncbi:MAG: 3-phosphoshikimate 1-carboxyvinyltransferase [Verrucomicrobia bacterium]|nr:MAG: 3-phosphoshikimate 1-carboxyvinyltransferase [Verrucomicrobiota bacterium]